MANVHGNRVSSFSGVIKKCLSLIVLDSESRILDIIKVFALFKTHACAIVCKALLEPEIIPPVHGHKIAKPHMRQFMDGNLNPHLLIEISLFIRRDQEGVSQDYKAHVFHATNSELWNKDLIIFGERERAREELFEEGYS